MKTVLKSPQSLIQQKHKDRHVSGVDQPREPIKNKIHKEQVVTANQHHWNKKVNNSSKTN